MNAARLARWEGETSKMDFTRSSRKCWSLIRRLGEAQGPPVRRHPPVKPNQVASHMLNVAKAPLNKTFKHRIQPEWRKFKNESRNASSQFKHFTQSEIIEALDDMKTGTSPGYDNMHPELLKKRGPLARRWLTSFVSRALSERKLPKIWYRAKVIALPKPEKDPNLPASYRPISLLSVCYKLLDRLILNRISPIVE